MSSKLTRSIVQGATWTGIAQILGHGLRFISLTVLARLLFPEDFGILATVTVVTSFTIVLIDFGFVEVVVQRKNITQKQLSSIFWIILIFGIILCLAVIALSPFLADFFNNPNVEPVLMVSSLIFILSPLYSVHHALLRKRLQFFRASISDIGEAIAYTVTALPAAFAGLGVWSMVLGNLAAYISSLILRWILSGWRPSFTLSIRSLGDLWQFGISILGNRIVYTVNARLDYFIIGKFLTPAFLGFYSMALRIAQIPSDGLGSIGSRVVLPAFSLVQDENERLRRGLLKGETFVSLIGIPIFTGLIFTAPELIKVLVGSKWMPSILPMQILCIFGIISVLNIGIPAMFTAKGKPIINLYLNLIQLALLAPALIFGTRFGPTGAAVAVSGVSIIVWLIRQIFVHKLIELSFKDYLLTLRPAFLISLILAAIILFERYPLNSLFNFTDTMLLTVEITTGIIAYLLFLRINHNQALIDIFKHVVDMTKFNRIPPERKTLYDQKETKIDPDIQSVNKVR